MIHAIGFRRFITLVILIGVAGVLAFFQYTVAIPQKAEAATELKALKNETATLKTELENMQGNMHIFQTRKAIFEEMKAKQVFGNQDRAEARDRVNAIQKLSKVVSAKYEIRPAEVEPVDVPEDFEYKVIKSSVKILLEAMDDTDIYHFIYYLNYGFPGHITIKSLSMERERGRIVDENTMKEIGRGNPIPLIKAELDVDWRTLTRKEDVQVPAPEPEKEGRGAAQ